LHVHARFIKGEKIKIVNSWGIAPIATPIDPPLSLPAYIIVQ